MSVVFQCFKDYLKHSYSNCSFLLKRKNRGNIVCSGYVAFSFTFQNISQPFSGKFQGRKLFDVLLSASSCDFLQATDANCESRNCVCSTWISIFGRVQYQLVHMFLNYSA